jgi:hypothetical protein
MTVPEKLADKVVRLAKELGSARAQIAACKHMFGEPVCATREFQEPRFLRYEGHGSDPEPVYEWIPRTEYGWARTCEVCGFSEYTARSKPVVVGHEPDFR